MCTEIVKRKRLDIALSEQLDQGDIDMHPIKRAYSETKGEGLGKKFETDCLVW